MLNQKKITILCLILLSLVFA